MSRVLAAVLCTGVTERTPLCSSSSRQQPPPEPLLPCQRRDTELQEKERRYLPFRLCRRPSQRRSVHQVSSGVVEGMRSLKVAVNAARPERDGARLLPMLKCGRLVCQGWEGAQVGGENLYDLGGEERVSRGGHRSVQSWHEQKREGEAQRKG